MSMRCGRWLAAVVAAGWLWPAGPWAAERAAAEDPPASVGPKVTGGKTSYVLVSVSGEFGKGLRAADFAAAMEKAAAVGADAIVIRLDVGGGRAGEADLVVGTMIRHRKRHLVGWVRRAVGAGAPIALCCGRVFVEDDARIGAAGDIEDTADTRTAWRRVCQRAAAIGDRPAALAVAMADPGFALTMTEKDGKLLFEEDGQGTVVRPKGTLLALGAKQAMACGLACAAVPDASKLAENLDAIDWAGGQPPPKPGPAGRDPNGPAAKDLADTITKKIAEFGLDAELTTLQREHALAEIGKWFKELNVRGKRVRWEVEVSEAVADTDTIERRRIASDLADARDSLRSAQSNMDSYRRHAGFGSGVPPEVAEELSRCQSRVAALNEALAHIDEYPFAVSGAASDAPRVSVSARCHKSAKQAILEAKVGSVLVLEGTIDRVRVDPTDMQVRKAYSIRVALTGCTATAK